MTSKFSLGPDRRVAIDIMKRLVRNNPDQKRVLDALLGILFKNEAALINMTDTPSAYDTGKYLKSTADGAVWDTPPSSTVNMCRLTCSSQAANTSSTVTWSAESYDTGSWWSSGDSATVPADGIYLFTAQADFTFAIDASARYARIYVRDTTNSVTIAERRISFDSPAAAIDQIIGCAGLYELSEDDVIKVYVDHDYAASKNFTNIIFSATQQD